MRFIREIKDGYTRATDVTGNEIRKVFVLAHVFAEVNRLLKEERGGEFKYKKGEQEEEVKIAKLRVATDDDFILINEKNRYFIINPKGTAKVRTKTPPIKEFLKNPFIDLRLRDPKKSELEDLVGILKIAK